MRLSDYKGEEALDVLADIIEPLTAIFADEEFRDLTKQKNTPVVKFVKPMIKNHKKELIEVLARLENKPVEEYKQGLTLMTLPLQGIRFYKRSGNTKPFSLAESDRTETVSLYWLCAGEYRGKRELKPFTRYFLARLNERQRAQAYQIYMSDALSSVIKIFSGGDIPRFYNIVNRKEEKPQESAEQVISRFDKLRRNKE